MTRSRKLAALTGYLSSLALVSLVEAQPAHRMAMPDATEITVTAESGVPEIPFEVINNHLVLQLSVNGSGPLAVVLDTGMPQEGLALHDSPRVAKLDLAIDPSIEAQVRGAGGSGTGHTARIAMDESITLPGLAIEKARVIVLPRIHDFTGYHEGIIGYTLFGRFVVELDYDHGVMRLHEPETYRAPDDDRVIPITFHNRLPYVPTRITPIGGEPYEAKVVVDLGASHAISLNTDTEVVDPPETSLETVLGRGLSGKVEGVVGRIAALELGGARLEDVVASFPVSRHQNPRGVDSLDGNLGNGILRRFNTTFDYSRSQMILVPNRSFSEPFKFDRSGLRLGMGHELVVEDVIADSPAAEAGIEVGDSLTHIDGRAVSGADYGAVREALRGDGEVRLMLRRGESEYERTLVLRKLI